MKNIEKPQNITYGEDNYKSFGQNSGTIKKN